MDETTYSDREIIREINSGFVPVRVDIDERPDISERYNKGGFPTTAFLSDSGESIWGGTYIPPQDMKRILKSIQEAKQSGQVKQALEQSRLKYLDLSEAAVERSRMDGGIIESIFEDVFASYDVQNGGFGTEPKFPQPDVIDLVIERYLETDDPELALAIEHTIQGMVEGVYDKVEGGIFRYSVTRDWRTPHYEKMLEGNAGFLRNTVRAYIALRKSKLLEYVSGTATYLTETLQDAVRGGFRGSQDADEDYYHLSCPQRGNVKHPEVSDAIYAGWNSEAASAMMEAGGLLQDQGWTDAGKKAFKYNLESLWNPEVGLIRHTKGTGLYLFEDQVAFMSSLLTMMEVEGLISVTRIADTLIDSVDRTFKDKEGGYSDIVVAEDAIGELGDGRRSLVSNSKWAKALALYGASMHRPGLTDKANDILAVFNQKEVQSYGLSAASYVSAWWMLEKGPLSVEIRGGSLEDAPAQQLWLTAKKTLNPRTIVVASSDRVQRLEANGGPFAVVCGRYECSSPITEPDELRAILTGEKASQF